MTLNAAHITATAVHTGSRWLVCIKIAGKTRRYDMAGESEDWQVGCAILNTIEEMGAPARDLLQINEQVSGLVVEAML